LNTIDSLKPGQNERILAVISHLSVIIPIMGIAVPIAIWSSQKGKSRYVLYHALQALLHQLGLLVVILLAGTVISAAMMAVMLILPFSTSTNLSLNDRFMELFAYLAIIAPLLNGYLYLLYLLYGVIGAVKIYQGKPFQYWVIGKRVERIVFSGKEQGKPHIADQ